ncbi:C6 finger domain-containing protein Acr-2 [Colletotrichum godetiae]|uniref:C6 finger domain-containing protein Acr-2 n=1 Tax=Colletotrichum godetiae TaxID=1209918 RepID=A0AAJ0ATJ0_9PEZI|nr:C6 finger domain-containing protein Acr-2 [Colletotrichum godetiae]KAK1690093.1 C6 finger domain-containing protein Acr-2 [Colletotrichum godetiae]
MPDASHASNSCWTCRQKRAKCDRLLPTCLRCTSLKLRCQGYDRPKKLVWTNSVASRGKMMGKVTFGADQEPNGDPLGKRPHQPDSLAVRYSWETLPEAQPFSLDVSWSLIDPDLQDLSLDCRKYIRYCKP